jgi:hypothetical protein
VVVSYDYEIANLWSSLSKADDDQLGQKITRIFCKICSVESGTPAQQLQLWLLPDTAIDVSLNKPHLSPIKTTFVTNFKLNVILPSPSLSSNWPFPSTGLHDYHM